MFHHFVVTRCYRAKQSKMVSKSLDQLVFATLNLWMECVTTLFINFRSMSTSLEASKLICNEMQVNGFFIMKTLAFDVLVLYLKY